MDNSRTTIYSYHMFSGSRQLQATQYNHLSIITMVQHHVSTYNAIHLFHLDGILRERYFRETEKWQTCFCCCTSATPYYTEHYSDILSTQQLCDWFNG